MGNNQGQQPDGNVVNDAKTEQVNNGVNVMNPPVAPQAPIRDFRPRRNLYNRAQKERAVRLLNTGIPCRQVARMIGPHCSSGNPVRWRQQARRIAEARRNLEEMLRRRGGQGQRFNIDRLID